MSQLSGAGAHNLAHRDTKAVDSGTPALARALRYVNSGLLNSAQELFVGDERQECVIVAAAPRIRRQAFHSLESR